MHCTRRSKDGAGPCAHYVFSVSSSPRIFVSSSCFEIDQKSVSFKNIFIGFNHMLGGED